MTGNGPIRHTLIMAAGRGNRMRPLTDIIPKAMAPYKGDTLIGNNLKMLHKSATYVHVTVGYKSAVLSEYLMRIGVDSILNTEGHGNAWWIHNTLLRYVAEPVLVLTCDNVTTLDVEFLATEYYEAGALACMVVPVKPIPMVEGDYIDHDNGIVSRIQRENPTDGYCSGIQVLNPAKVASLTENVDDFRLIWNELIAHRQLSASNVYPYPWFSVDTLEQLAGLSR
jgi:NDP-sugar pyrophosphorylase family protein